MNFATIEWSYSNEPAQLTALNFFVQPSAAIPLYPAQRNTEIIAIYKQSPER